MKNFLVKCFVFIFICCIVAYSLAKISNKTDFVYEWERLRINQLLERKSEIEALFVGNSLQDALDESALGLANNGYHIWQGGNDVFETFYQVRAVAPYLPNLKLIFCTIGYSTFYWDNSFPFPYKDKLANRRRYYATIPSTEYIPGDLSYYILSRFYPIIRPDHWEGVFRPSNKLSAKRSLNMSLSGLRIEPEEKPITLDEFNERVIKTSEGTNSFAKYPEYDKNVHERTFKCLENMVEYANKRNIQVIFVTPPFYYRYNETCYQESKEITAKYMRKLTDETNAVYLNFADNREFNRDYTLYTDPTHLSKKGARLFSHKLKKILNQKNFYKEN